MELAVHRLPLEVVQRVVHPAHVPLHAEAEAADIGRPRDQRPGGRLLGDRLGVALLLVDLDVEAAQEVDRLQVLAAAELVGDPLALLARVVEVEHRGDRVDAQAVGVVAVEPAQRAADQKSANLVAAVVEDRAAPVRVDSEAWVGVLEEMGTVEVLQAELIGGKVRWDPVQDHADPVLMQVVDEEHEVLRRAVPAGRREVAGDLVAPGLVERMLHHRHELDVREAHAAHVVGETRRELAVRQPAVAFLRHAHPRAKVHLVHGERRVAVVGRAAALHPAFVAPVVSEVPHDRGLAGRRLGVRGERVGLVDAGARRLGVDVVLVDRAMAHGGDETLPDAGLLARVEAVGILVPAVEVADHAHGVRVRRPHREVRAFGVVGQVRAKLVE